MICPNCGRNIPDTSERCAHCGQPTEFSSVRNQRPQPPVIRQAPGYPIENPNPSNEALERLAARVKALPTASDLRLNLRRHILISVAAVLLAAVICFVLGFSFGSARAKTPATDAALAHVPSVQAPQQKSAGGPAQYTVTFDKGTTDNSVKGMPPSFTIMKTEDTYIIKVKPTRQGYQFKEWNTKKDGSGDAYLPGDPFKTDEDITLYAIWVLYVPTAPSATPTPTLATHTPIYASSAPEPPDGP